MAESRSVSICRKTGACDNFQLLHKGQSRLRALPPKHSGYCELGASRTPSVRGVLAESCDVPGESLGVAELGTEELGTRTAVFTARSPGKGFSTSPDTHRGPAGDGEHGWAVIGQRRLPRDAETRCLCF